MKLISLLVLLLLPIGFAQACFTELSQGFSDEQLAGHITNIEAAYLVKRAVDLLEPNLPPLNPIPANFDLTADSENYEIIRFLLTHNLLSDQSDLEKDDFKSKLINRLRSWYSLESVELAEELPTIEFISVLSNTINLLELNPVALVASAEDKNTIGFWSIIRNDSVYPRMIVFNPPDSNELSLNNGVKGVIGSLSNCAYSVQKYIFSNADTAKQLFLSNYKSRMIIVDSTPNILDGFMQVPQGEEIDYFAFLSPTLEKVTSYSAVFTEQKVNPLKIMRLLPKVRTNMNPKQILSFLQGN